jgi:tetratricopeptide (TPR) repeat protein
MAKINSKYFYMLTIAIISFVLFNVGCSSQPKRVDSLEEKVSALSHSVESLEPKIYELKEKLSEQGLGIATALNSQNSSRNRLEEGLRETRNLLQEIKQRLALIEEDKDKMQAQLNKLETLCSKSTSAEAKLTEGLLDKAIKLYRQGEFEEAISKWEEALARDPGKLEAKFNIEIAKDRIKEKEMHEELKALLIQRK